MGRRALAIGAHPDDCEVGCGGTVARLVCEGWDVTFLICTNGNKGSHNHDISPYRLSDMREIEARAAARVLGVQQVVFLRYNDGELEATAALKAEMALYIRHFRPHWIFTHDPWRPYMLHPDHRAVGFAVVDGVVQARDHLYLPGLAAIGLPHWRPESLLLWKPERIDSVEPIEDTVATKIAALNEHRSQVQETGYWDVRVRRWAREDGQIGGMAMGEGFKKIGL